MIIVKVKHSPSQPVGEIMVNFDKAEGDIDLSEMIFDTDVNTKKSILYMPTWPKVVEEKHYSFQNKHNIKIMTNQTTQQSTLNAKGKATASLILGIVSVILLISIRLIPMALASFGSFVVGIILPLIAIIGLILGVLGLKSTKRNFAIAGVVLCAIGLSYPIYRFIF